MKNKPNHCRRPRVRDPSVPVRIFPVLSSKNVKTSCTLVNGDTGIPPTECVFSHGTTEARISKVVTGGTRRKTATQGPRNHKTLLTKIYKSRLLILTNASKGYDVQIFHPNVGHFLRWVVTSPQVKTAITEMHCEYEAKNEVSVAKSWRRSERGSLYSGSPE